MKSRQAGLGFIFVTLVLDILGIGIVVPIVPRLFADMLHGDLSAAAQYFGWYGGVYALMQFLCAPTLGHLSDRFGRRPVLLLALLGAGLDYLMLAVAPNVIWLFVGRIIAGIMGASLTVATAYLADVSSPTQRAQHFGLIGTAEGVGFILGPAIGGMLSIYGVRVPFYVAAVLNLLNALYGFFVLPESLGSTHRRRFSWRHTNPIAVIGTFGRSRSVSWLIAVIVITTLAYQARQSTGVIYTIYRFAWTPFQNGVLLALTGGVIAMMQ